MDDNRNESIDMIRGFCVFGFGFFNTLDCLPTNTSIDLIKLLFNDIFWIILSVIFGFGISSFFRKNENKKLFIRRIVILFILGMVNSFFIKGDILKNYAISGLIFLIILKLIDIKFIRYLPIFLLSIITILLIVLKKDYPNEITNGNLFQNNFLYNWQLNFSSSFYSLFFNISVLFFMSIGYCFGINTFSIGLIKKYNLFFLIGIVLFFIATIIRIKNLDLNYFLYTVLLSLLIFGNLFFSSNSFKNMKLISISRLSLSIYIFQNIINSILTYYNIFGQSKVYDLALIIFISILFPILLSKNAENNGLIFEKMYRK